MSKKYKKILIFVFLLVFIAVIIFLFLKFSGEVPPPPNLIRASDIAGIQVSMEAYYDKNNLKYLQSPIMPISIEDWVIPKDPRGEPYEWIDNTSDSQKFCVWAVLEEKDAYYLASHCGKRKASQQPTTLDECCELSKPEYRR